MSSQSGDQKYKIKVQAGWFLMRTFPGLQTAAFSPLHPPVDLTLGTVRTCSLMRTLDLMAHGPTLRPSFNFLRSPVSKDTLGFRTSTCKLCRHNIQSMHLVVSGTGEQSTSTHFCSQQTVVVECWTLWPGGLGLHPSSTTYSLGRRGHVS